MSLDFAFSVEESQATSLLRFNEIFIYLFSYKNSSTGGSAFAIVAPPDTAPPGHQGLFRHL